MSVDAVQLRLICEHELAEPVSPVGTDGGGVVVVVVPATVVVVVVVECVVEVEAVVVVVVALQTGVVALAHALSAEVAPPVSTAATE